MWTLLFAFAISGVNPHCDNALVALPFDLQLGEQTITLRKPLVNRLPGARLILYTRDSVDNVDHARSPEAFQEAFPLGSIAATVHTADTSKKNSLRLVHTGYSYYKGAKGLVLTVEDEQASSGFFTNVEVNSMVKMSKVKAVWIDRGGRNIRDLAPTL